MTELADNTTLPAGVHTPQQEAKEEASLHGYLNEMTGSSSNTNNNLSLLNDDVVYVHRTQQRDQVEKKEKEKDNTEETKKKKKKITRLGVFVFDERAPEIFLSL